jgi:hypothetical protein
VEIIPFPDFNNLQPLMPEEIQKDELLGWINGGDNAPEPPQPINENIQIGMVQLQDSWPQHPSFGPCLEAIRQWVRYFSFPSGNYPIVLIPDPWVLFFSFLLL